MLSIPIIARTTEEALQDMESASQLADLIELRLDYIENPDLEKLMEKRSKPIIVTNRPKRQGGRFEGPEAQRIALLEKAVDLGVEYVDIEYDSVGDFVEKAGAKIIVSYHNLNETPNNLKEIHKGLADTGASVVKIATLAQDITDNLKVFRLLEEVSYPLTAAFCMGELGQISRILAPRFGSFITFASLDQGKESAPGQLTARELLDVYHLFKINRTTSLYGLVGNPVAHSLGPLLHNTVFRKQGINAVYLPFKVEDLDSFVKGFKTLDVQGYSITIPHKEGIIKLLDGLDPLARQIGAVNTVVNRGGRLTGYNTDSTAAVRVLDEGLRKRGQSIQGKKVTILGAGGAARAVAFGLKEKGAEVTIVNRTEQRARTLARDLGCGHKRFKDLAALETEVLINCTSVGMHPGTEETPVSADVLRPGMWVFDIVYNPPQTRLLREAGQRGCHTLNGLQMFVYQASQQFELWTGRQAPFELMEGILREHLSGSRKGLK